MHNDSPFLELIQPCDRAVEWLERQLRQAGFRVMRTFDLQSARQAQPLCPCPDHGTEQCDCQMVVLLVYLANLAPVTVIAHGHQSQTWFSLVDSPQQRADPRLEGMIRTMVASRLGLQNWLENHPGEV